MSKAGLLEPKQVFAKLDAQPPLMRIKAWKAYIGKRVDWIAAFFSGEPESKGRVFLAFRHEESNRMIFVYVSITKYPWLESTRRGELVRLRGRIVSVKPLTIDLKDVTLVRVIKATC